MGYNAWGTGEIKFASKEELEAAVKALKKDPASANFKGIEKDYPSTISRSSSARRCLNSGFPLSTPRMISTPIPSISSTNGTKSGLGRKSRLRRSAPIASKAISSGAERTARGGLSPGCTPEGHARRQFPGRWR